VEKVTLKPRTIQEIKDNIIINLKYIFDPEIPVNIYDLGLIYNMELEIVKNYMYCRITMTLTSPACPVADSILGDVYLYTRNIAEIDEVDIKLVFDPPWDNTKISQEGIDILELEGTVLPQY